MILSVYVVPLFWCLLFFCFTPNAFSKNRRLGGVSLLLYSVALSGCYADRAGTGISLSTRNGHIVVFRIIFQTSGVSTYLKTSTRRTSPFRLRGMEFLHGRALHEACTSEFSAVGLRATGSLRGSRWTPRHRVEGFTDNVTRKRNKK